MKNPNNVIPIKLFFIIFIAYIDFDNQKNFFKKQLFETGILNKSDLVNE